MINWELTLPETVGPVCDYSVHCCANIISLTHSFQHCSATNTDIFRQAALDGEVFKIALEVMEMYHEGQTKGQKPSS